jgi:hypothetical protein
MFVLHDSTSAHSAMTVNQLVTKCNTMKMSHPFYPPDLETAIFYLFLEVKTTLKG